MINEFTIPPTVSVNPYIFNRPTQYMFMQLKLKLIQKMCACPFIAYTKEDQSTQNHTIRFTIPWEQVYAETSPPMVSFLADIISNGWFKLNDTIY